MASLPAVNPLPVKPTVIPQARKYTRTFNAASGKVFSEHDQITIEIPPIPNTYLTKSAKLYFNFDMSFKDHSYTASTPGLPTGWFSETNPNVWNVLRKPVPMLERCGAYAFFRDIEVYDYLGGTLIEKTTRHDLLASIMADFYLDAETERLCPLITENQNSIFPYINSTTLDPLGSSFYGPSVQTHVNGINLLDVNQNGLLHVKEEVLSSIKDFYTYVTTPPKADAETVVIPTWLFSIDLLNFLGRGSSTYVPLHNGFRIVLKLNPSTVPVKFSLPNGGLIMTLKNGSSLSIIPQITNFTISNVNLRADLLEISPDLDKQVDKVIRSRMTSYVLLGRCDKPTILPGNFQSVNSYRVAMRHLNSTENPLSGSDIGYRSRTYVNNARLLYNGAIQQHYKTVEEIRNALGTEFDPTIQADAFQDETIGGNIYGTAGYLYPYPSHEFKYALAKSAPSGNYAWVNDSANVQNVSTLNTIFTRTNNQAGKFLIYFDLSLNGYNQNTITGIDTTKTTISLDLNREKPPSGFDLSEPWETDVFIDHDAIITVEPGKYTTVSF